MKLSFRSNVCRFIVALIVVYSTYTILVLRKNNYLSQETIATPDNPKISYLILSQETKDIIPQFPPIARWLTSNTSECVPKKNIGFLKTHKCASSAVQNILLRFAYDHNLSFAIPRISNYFGNGINSFTAKMVKETPWYKLGVNIFAIHTRWHHKEMISLMPKQTVYLTIVREPTEMFESLYSYYSFEEDYGQNISEFVQNHGKCTKRKNGKYGYNQMAWDAGLSLEQMDNESAAMELAETMDGQFDLVMVSERMEESLVLMSRLLCWNLTDVLVLKINFREVKFKESMDGETRNLLKERLSLDYILYNHFVRKFDKMVEAYGKERMERDVTDLRKASAELMETCGFASKSKESLTGVYKPLFFMVSGYEPMIKTEKCKHFSMAELFFLEELRVKQNQNLRKKRKIIKV